MAEKARILIVDDERTNRKVLADLLKAEHQILPAKDGQQALQRLASEPDIDLVLLDVMMPEMDGYEVLRRMKAEETTKEIPVIFITALDSTGDEETGLKLGATDYITKPFHPAIVQARVENHLSFARQRKLLETLAGRDGLTEIPNRRCFDEHLHKEWQRGRRNGRTLSLALVDVDHFKPFNDTYGHAAGDRALRSVAQALARSLRRPGDLAARIGGEEFALLFPETETPGARHIAEQARASVFELSIEHSENPAGGQISISIGGAGCIPEGESPHALLEAADGCLYTAKEQGRNRVVFAAGW